MVGSRNKNLYKAETFTQQQSLYTLAITFIYWQSVYGGLNGKLLYLYVK